MTTNKLADQALHRRTEADAKAPEFWVVCLDTRHFSFEAYGMTDASCRDAMRRALTAHAAALFHCPPDFVETSMADVHPQKRSMGEGYRDNQCLTGGK